MHFFFRYRHLLQTLPCSERKRGTAITRLFSLLVNHRMTPKGREKKCRQGMCAKLPWKESIQPVGKASVRFCCLGVHHPRPLYGLWSAGDQRGKWASPCGGVEKSALTTPESLSQSTLSFRECLALTFSDVSASNNRTTGKSQNRAGQANWKLACQQLKIGKIENIVKGVSSPSENQNSSNPLWTSCKGKKKKTLHI